LFFASLNLDIFVSFDKLISLKGYLNKITTDNNNNSQLPSIVASNKEILFGNIKEIYQFHSKLFLSQIEAAQCSISEISKLFIKFVNNLNLLLKFIEIP
jgi:hypothetical protein